MDAFAVSLVGGATIHPLTGRHVFRLAFHFGLFQFLMPIIGWLAGTSVIDYIAAFDHWIAFGLLGLIGSKMIYESFQPTSEITKDISRGCSLVGLSLATSIDALAIGITLSALRVEIWYPSVIIGLVAAGFSIAGIFIGRKGGRFLGKRFELIGGLILIGIGVKILIEHLI